MSQQRSIQELANVPLSKMSNEELKSVWKEAISKRTYTSGARARIILDYRDVLANASKFKGNGSAATHVNGVQPFKFNGCKQLEDIVEKQEQVNIEQSAAKVNSLAGSEENREASIERNPGIPSPEPNFDAAAQAFKRAQQKLPEDVLTTDDMVRYRACVKLKADQMVQKWRADHAQEYADELNRQAKTAARDINKQWQDAHWPGQIDISKVNVVTADQVRSTAITQWQKDQDQASKISDQTPVSTAEHIWEAYGTPIQMVGGGVVFAAGLLGPDLIVIPLAAVVGGSTSMLAYAGGDNESAIVNALGALPLGLLGRLFGFGADGANLSRSAVADKIAKMSKEEILGTAEKAAQQGEAEVASTLRNIAEKEHPPPKSKTPEEPKPEKPEPGTSDPETKQKPHPDGDPCPCNIKK